MSKTDRLTVRVDKELRERLEKLADDKKVSVATIILDFIYNSLDPEKKRYKCISESFVDGKFKCVVGRVNNTPNIKYLAKDEDEKNDVCLSCVDRLKEIEENLSLRAQLEADKTITMPRCVQGGYLNKDMTEMYCPKIGKFRPIMERKRKSDYKPCRLETPSNANCSSLRYVTVIRGLKKEKTGENL